MNSSANTALDNLVSNAPINKATLLSALTTASDHLPVVADYSILLPLVGDLDLDGRRTIGDVTSLMNAVQDLATYKSAHLLSDSDLLSVGDINGRSRGQQCRCAIDARPVAKWQRRGGSARTGSD